MNGLLAISVTKTGDGLLSKGAKVQSGEAQFPNESMRRAVPYLEVVVIHE